MLASQIPTEFHSSIDSLIDALDFGANGNEFDFDGWSLAAMIQLAVSLGASRKIILAAMAVQINQHERIDFK